MGDPAYLVDGVLTEGDPWVCLASNKLGDSSTQTVSWNSGTGNLDWSQYQSLFIVWYARSMRSGVAYDNLYFRIGQGSVDSSSYRAQNWYVGSGGAVAYQFQPTGLDAGYMTTADDSQAGSFSGGTLEIQSTGTGKWKTGIYTGCGINTDLDGYSSLGGTSYSGSSHPITSIQAFCAYSTFKINSEFTLYGVLPKMALTGIL